MTERERQAGDSGAVAAAPEILVTEEMMYVGAEALREYDYRFESIESAVSRIFLSMAHLRVFSAPDPY